jgi:chromosome segregation ATPase
MARVTTVKRAQVRKDKQGAVKPNHVCEVCRTEIKPGDPYKWVAPKTGPRTSIKRYRCATCPTWASWDLSNALWARIAKIQNDYSGTELDPAEVRSALESAADEIQELADEKHEGASNIEDGFGHPTEKSEELEQIASDLENWAYEVRDKAGEIEDFEDEVECDTCGGTGKLAETVEGDADTDPEEPCTECDGSGQVENPELADKQAELEEALAILDESPV